MAKHRSDSPVDTVTEKTKSIANGKHRDWSRPLSVDLPNQSGPIED